MGNVKKGAAEERHYLYVTMHRSNLPDAKGRWLARTANNRTLDIDAVCGSMITRGHSTGNHDEMITIVRRFFNEAAYLLADGFAVNMEYFTMYPVIRGSFRTEREVLRTDDLKVEFHFRSRAPLRRLAGLVQFKILGRREPGVIERFTDTASGTVNRQLTSGNLFVISGGGIKAAGAAGDECGVWFVSQADGRRFRVTIPLIKNTAGTITGIAPELPAGAYTVEIVTRSKPAGGGLLKNARTVKSRFTLTV